MEDIVVESIDYSSQLSDILSSQSDILSQMEVLNESIEALQSYTIPIVSGIWTFVTVIVPLCLLVVSLWWFFKQFLYEY